MGRYIDADKLKKLRDDVISGKVDIQTEGDLIDACPTVNPYEWINVDDMLPDKDGRYLVAIKNGNEFHISTRKFRRADPPVWWKGHTYGYWARYTGGVRFWMPLPAPPNHRRS